MPRPRNDPIRPTNLPALPAGRFEDPVQETVEIEYMNSTPLTEIAEKTGLARYEIEDRLRQIEDDLARTMDGAMGDQSIRARRVRILLRSEARSVFLANKIQPPATAEGGVTAAILRAPDWIKLAQAEDKLQMDVLTAIEEVEVAGTPGGGLLGGGGYGSQPPRAPQSGLMGELLQGARAALNAGDSSGKAKVSVELTASLEQATYDGGLGGINLRRMAAENGP